jgi:hypothetical protein
MAKPHGWQNHINGAVALVKLRQEKKIQSYVGKLLHVMVRSHLVQFSQIYNLTVPRANFAKTVHCLSTSTSPTMGTDWWMKSGVEDTFTTVCARLNLKTAELRAESDCVMNASTRTPDGIEKVLFLMRKAEALESEYVNTSSSLPSQWQYRHVMWIEQVQGQDIASMAAFPGRLDSYEQMWMATVWNLARASRLVISCIIIRCTAWLCTPSDYRLSPEYSKAANQSKGLIEDIIASVPTFLGTADEALILDSQIKDSYACGNSQSTGTGLSAKFILWPLFVVFSSDFTTEMQREWVRGRLRFMSESIGVGMAQRFSKVWPSQIPLGFQLTNRSNLKSSIRVPSLIVQMDVMNAKNHGFSDSDLKRGRCIVMVETEHGEQAARCVDVGSSELLAR